MAERNECPNCGSAKNDGRCPNCIITAVMLEVKKPLTEDWDTFGAQLRGLRSMSHRLLNAGMLGLVADLKSFEARKRQGKTKPDEKFTKVYSYPHICHERDAYAAWARTKRQQAALAAADAQSAALRARSESKREELKAEAKRLEAEAARLEAIETVATTLPSEMLAYANFTTDKKFRLWLKSRDDRLPMYRKKAPILLPPVGCEVLEVEKNAVRLKLKIRNKGSVGVLAVPVSGSAWRSMRWIATKEAKPGDCKLTYDEGKKKWFIRLTVTRPRPEPPPITPGIVLALNRGRYNFLYGVANDSRTCRVIWPGSDIKEFKERIRARMLKLKNMRHHRGCGARGHGKARFFAAETRLETIESNFVRTICQQAAAEVDRQARNIGAGTIVIEDFTTIEAEDLRYIERWPWYQLKQAITWMCEKTGRTLVEVPSEYISSECPRCGNLDTAQVNIATGVFHCKGACANRNGYSRESDFVACYTMLRRSESDMSAWDRLFKTMDRVTPAAE